MLNILLEVLDGLRQKIQAPVGVQGVKEVSGGGGGVLVLAPGCEDG